jgi:hypothetical protein
MNISSITNLRWLKGIIFLLTLDFWFEAQAAMVTFTIENSIGQPDTNIFRIFPISTPIDVSGTYFITGKPIQMQPDTNGYCETNLLIGSYIITNQFFNPAVIFTVTNNLPTVTNSAASLVASNAYSFNWSGFIPIPGNMNSNAVVALIRAFGGNATNAIGLNNGVGTNLTIYGIFISTNLNAAIQLATNNALKTATNSFDALGAAQAATNAFVGMVSNMIRFSTNSFVVSISTQAITSTLLYTFAHNLGHKPTLSYVEFYSVHQDDNTQYPTGRGFALADAVKSQLSWQKTDDETNIYLSVGANLIDNWSKITVVPAYGGPTVQFLSPTNLILRGVAE